MPHPLLPPDFWAQERERLLAILLPRLTQAAQGGAQTALNKFPRLAFDNDLHNAQAADWARQHTDFLLGQLQTTTENRVGAVLDEWISTSGATTGDLKTQIRDALQVNASRADAIAVTETTRAYANGEKAAYQAASVKRWKWMSNRDELTCPVCGPLHGKTVDIGEPFTVWRGDVITEPPAHPRCRCWVAPVVESGAGGADHHTQRGVIFQR